MERLRTPFFIVAMVAAGLVVLIELGSPWAIGGVVSTNELVDDFRDLGLDVPGGGVEQPVGLAIRYLALVDVIPLLTVGLMGASLLLPDRVDGPVQSVATLIAAIALITTSIILIVVAIARLIAMVTLLLAVPFGTLAYLILYGQFPRGQATVLLALIMLFKLVFAAFLVAAQPRFVQNKGLVALVATSLLANVAVVFLHGLLPRIFVSILDAVAAILVAVIAIAWGIVLLVGAILGIVAALRASAASAADITPAPVTNPPPLSPS